ncbi:MAG: TerD family protein [Actinomycetales bacterium]
MPQLSKGGNAPLTTPNVVITVDVSAPADLSALLVTGSGKVRTDADFVFYNQPTGPGVRCVPPAGGAGWKVEVDTAAVPGDIEAVRIVSSLDNGTFGALPTPVAHVRDTSGADLVDFPVSGLATETIVVVLELYRRQGAWKVRAVGQGYAGGLADLIRDHGVSVDDEPASPAPAQASPAPAQPGPAPQASPPPQASPAPPAAQPSAPAAPAYGQAPPQYGGQAPAAPQYGQPPQGPGQGQPPQAPQYGQPPQAPAYGQPQQQYGQPPAQPPQAPPGQPPQYGQPPAQPPGRQAQPPQAQPPQGGGSSGEVSLSKGRTVSLSKGQKVTLTKDGGEKLTVIRMGLGWDPIKRGGMFGRREVDIDLDASAILLAGDEPVDIAFYNNLRTRDGSIQHMGDNRTGEGDGDDEVMIVDLTRVPVHIDTIYFIVTSYEGQTFQQVANAFVRLVDHTTGAELARYALHGGMPFTGLVMARVYRQGGDWKLQAIGEGIQAKYPQEAIPQILRNKAPGQAFSPGS